MMRDHEIDYLRLFTEVCKQINASLNINEVLSSIAEHSTKALDAKGAAVFLLDAGRQRLQLSGAYGLSRSYLTKGPLEAERSIAPCLRGETVLVEDVETDPRIQYPDEARKEGVASIYSVPMAVQGRIIGVLRIYSGTSHRFSEIEREFVAGLAEIGSLGIENARMHNDLRDSYDQLIIDVHEWFESGKMR